MPRKKLRFKSSEGQSMSQHTFLQDAPTTCRGKTWGMRSTPSAMDALPQALAWTRPAVRQWARSLALCAVNFWIWDPQIQRLTAHKASDRIARDCLECVTQGGNCCGYPLNIGVVRRWILGDITGPQGVVYNGPPPSPPAATPGECPPSLQPSHVFLLLHLTTNIAAVLMYCHALQYYCFI